MIESGLEFGLLETSKILERILRLSQALRPTHQSVGEDEAGTPIDDGDKALRSLSSFGSGIYLKNHQVTYDLRRSKNESIVCNGYFKLPPYCVEEFLIDMAAVNPLFGFACAPEEREARNRITTKQNVSFIESWVGRDTQKYIPGLYWLTLLPMALAERHGVLLSVLKEVALDYVELNDGQHLFRFYQKPEDWRSTDVVANLCASLPGVFDVEKARSQLAGAKNFLDLNAMIGYWR